jgi:hypothetical protein
MASTGSASSLSERLRAKMEADRMEVEKLTSNELEKLASSLRSASAAALSSTESAISERMKRLYREMGRIERDQKRWPLWSGAGALALSGSILIGLWAFSGWQRSELASLQAQIVQERNTLGQLQSHTGGVRLVEAPNGWFLMFPTGTDTKTTYDCQGQSCIKLGK